ncbi:hypothetical protein ACFW5V_28755 [Streptomyces sp. NPDC058762]|uniref:hypothetical protein n=1 Tax=Streptomyces sp. NPDC058762 TaxID=3346629 RepID=UPI00369D643D
MTSQPLTEQQLAAIQARADAATPGPWGTYRGLNARYTVQARPRTTRNGMENDGDIATLPTDRTDADSYANARFLAHAREDVPALLAEIQRLTTERDAFADRVAELERPATEAHRNEIRSSFTGLIAQASQDRDHEGAFALECQLRDREEQWKREAEEAGQ